MLNDTSSITVKWGEGLVGMTMKVSPTQVAECKHSRERSEV